MSKCIVVVLLFGYALCKPHARGNVDNRVLGGVDAEEGQFPYQASLQGVLLSEKYHLCGAAILTSSWLLTAAHCLIFPFELEVYVGSMYLSKGGQYYEVSKVIEHEDFDLQHTRNDIGLVQISGSFEFNDRVAPIKLPINSPIQPNVSLVLTGWGNVDKEGSPTDILQVGYNLTAYSDSYCASMQELEVQEEFLCAGKGPGYGACHGDSGGPLAANGVLYGLVSFGSGPYCGSPKPDFYARVKYYVDWIIKHLGEDAIQLAYN